jgi:beta-lactamase regulating signal transducer with metallopeptidase domain
MIAAMIKSGIVLALAACIASLMRRQSAAVRHTIWTAGLIGAMAIPICTLALPSWRPEIATRASILIQQTIDATGGFRQVAIVLWIAGATLGMMLLFYGACRLAWVAIRSEPVNDARWATLAEEVRRRLGIRRPVRLLQNRSVPFLGTWGILVPRVLLPSDAEKWSDDRIRMVLAHELSHIKRLDWVVQVLADAARAIYWFNPIFWLASSRLRRESEHACDDAVVRMGAAGTHYAEELLAMTRTLRSGRGVEHPILAMAQPSHLEQRLVALLNPSLNRLAATPWAVIVVAGFAIALTLPLATLRSTEIAATVQAPAPPSAVAAPVAPVVAESLGTSPVPTNSRSVVAGKASSSTLAPVADEPEPAQEIAAEPPPPSTLQPASPIEPPVVAELPAPPPVAPQPPAPAPAAAVVKNTSPPFQCNVTSSRRQLKTASIQKEALGDGPWLINEDRTIWAADQPYIANRAVNTVWMRPANTQLTIAGRRLDGDAPQLQAGPAAPFNTGYIAIGLTFPAAGCWEVTATAGTSKLTFITRVRE